ncbi:hypothetical protein [Pseudarthrobacter sp. YAF2]|uniref:hypothetical protein n=1 Tax=Pseudarthrobacter sp. YAF2 TaxID=3233078 RepID=UPI003F99EC22
MNPSPWAALLAPKTPSPTTTHDNPETQPEGSPAAPGPISAPVIPVPSYLDSKGIWSHRSEDRSRVAGYWGQP